MHPARNVAEQAERAAKATGDFFSETNEKYQVSDKAVEVASKTKEGFMNLWNKAVGSKE